MKTSTTSSRIFHAVILTLMLPYFLAGCSGTVTGTATLKHPILGSIELDYDISWNFGPDGLTGTNNGDEPVWVQPVDGNGNAIGDPVEIPPKGTVTLPSNTRDVEIVMPPKEEKEEEQNQEQATAASPGLTFAAQLRFWGGNPIKNFPAVINSLGEDGEYNFWEYQVKAQSPQGALAAMAGLQGGQSTSKAQLVAHTQLRPLSTSIAELNLLAPSSKLVAFEVHVNGVVVASSFTGLGEATVSQSSGSAVAYALFPADLLSNQNQVAIYLTDDEGNIIPSTIDYQIP